ncbi:hypothetical protein SAMN05660733_04467 [Lentzea albidocapillata]|uniref:Uncharacterized protein n=1 Tax=Lentzea albidocapillata TaxID=40571 RepID=A0A1W2ESB0_9PSEU|nr:hypothetical protein SAMN05660733_04467 [Lentzea albidocapillata]
MIARCLTASLRTTLRTMNEWTPEAIKAEIDYRRGNAVCNWRRSNGRGPSWLSRMMHRTISRAR